MKTQHKTMEHESRIRKVMFNEVSLTVAVIGFVLSAVFWIQNPQHDLKIEVVKLQTQIESNQTVAAELAKIKNNDLHELHLRMDRIEERQIEELKAIARIEALLKLNQ